MHVLLDLATLLATHIFQTSAAIVGTHLFMEMYLGGCASCHSSLILYPIGTSSIARGGKTISTADAAMCSKSNHVVDGSYFILCNFIRSLSVFQCWLWTNRSHLCCRLYVDLAKRWSEYLFPYETISELPDFQERLNVQTFHLRYCKD